MAAAIVGLADLQNLEGEAESDGETLEDNRDMLFLSKIFVMDLVTMNAMSR